MGDCRSCGRCQHFYNGQCMEESQCMRDVDEARYNGLIEGRRLGKADAIEKVEKAITKIQSLADECKNKAFNFEAEDNIEFADKYYAKQVAYLTAIKILKETK